MRAEWIVVGGGIAGLATAQALGRAGLGPGVLFEREPLCGAHASGRNAGIFRLAEPDPVVRALARRSLGLLASPPAHGRPLVTRTGGLTLAREAEAPDLEALAGEMRRESLAAELLPMRAARARFPELGDCRAAVALWCRDEGVIDVHALVTSYRAVARAQGCAIQTRSPVDSLLREGGRVAGVRVNGQELRSDLVIDAAGAWAGRLTAPPDAPLPLRPLRRHLFVTGRPAAWRRDAPFLWMLGDACYARPEGGGLLASPCDETPCDPGEPALDASAAERLAGKLLRWSPVLGDVPVRRAWACLRTFTPDRRPLVGADPSAPGTFHVSGLGGFGMTASAAIGELAASLVAGDVPTWIDTAGVAVARFSTRTPGGTCGGPTDRRPQ